MKRRSLLALCLGALAGSLLGQPAFAQQQTLTIGLIPSEDAQAMLENSKEVIAKLEQQLGMKVKPFISTDYNGIIEALRAKKLDIAYLGPFSYALATTVANVEAFAVPETKKSGKTSYNSLLITRKDSGLATLAQLKGKTLAFVDPSSASGHLFPNAGLTKAGYEPAKYFSRVIFSGSHDASILAVANKKVDAAAVASPILALAVSKGVVKQDDLNIVWTSPDIPESPMVWRKDLSPELRARIAAAFGSLKGVTWGDRGELNGFVATNDAAYNVVRDTAKILNLDLKAMK